MTFQLSEPTDEAVDELLSRPTLGVMETLRRLDGDVIVLGAGGKMGPTLARMIRRGWDALNCSHKVIGAARFSDAATEERLCASGIETRRCDLLDRAAVQQLPDAPNVIFMAGHKFGASAAPELTWAMNTLVPANVAEKYSAARIVVFSTGCIYPFSPVQAGGSREDDAIGPIGDYANSCVGRERIFTYFSRKNETPLAIVRLNYAIDLRYGVLLDVARKVWDGEPLDLTMGHVNVIWQGDANAQAIQCLEHAASRPFVINITGPETVSVRALAQRFGEVFEREPIFFGAEGPTAWLSDASRARQLFGPPSVNLEEMILWVAQWVRQGGHTLNKPTHFETRDGNF